MHFTYGAITLWGAASQQLPLYRRFVTLYVQVRCSHLTTPLSEDRGLGFSLFARRYSGYHESRVPSARTYAPTERNSYCSLFLLVLRCFTSQGSHRAGVTPRIPVQNWRVSPFGYLRIKGYKPPPRSFSQVSRVLHSRPRPRHPPCALNCLPRGDLYTTIITICTLILPAAVKPRRFSIFPTLKA